MYMYIDILQSILHSHVLVELIRIFHTSLCEVYVYRYMYIVLTVFYMYTYTVHVYIHVQNVFCIVFGTKYKYHEYGVNNTCISCTCMIVCRKYNNVSIN